ncbi:MAG: hypothetical protein FWD44_10255 [Oscillospiraceae bacterium]|nr:hypothetical protein [Oscillospiraceae bacterium]
MAEEAKMTGRDQALIGILERLAAEMQDQDDMLEDLLKRTDALSKATGAAQSNDPARDYRSDMLSLVNEQDRINKNIDDLEKVVKTAAYALDVTNQKLIGLDERLGVHEKVSNEYYAQAQKQPAIFQEALDNSSRNFAKLHAETEKRLGEMYSETTRQLDKFQHETTRRLLLLDSIVTSLQTLLIRTEPPVKKPSWISRMFKRIGTFFRFRLPFKMKKEP